MLVLATVAVLRGPAAAGPTLDAAREAKGVLDYERALALAGEALRSGDNERAELVEIYRLAGEVAAGLDRTDEAEMWFKRLLALEPTATLPVGTSPKITGPFERARAFIEERGALAVRHEAVPGGVVLHVDRDPLGMVDGARAYVQTSDVRLFVLDGRGETRIHIEVPQNGFANKVVAIDEHGNELAAILLAARVTELDVVGQRRDRAGRGWWLSAGVTVASLGAGIYFGLDTRDAEKDLAALNESSQDGPIAANEAHELVRRGRRSAILANVGFAATGVGAVITGWLVYRRLSAPASTVAVTPVVGGDGGGFMVRLRF